MRRQQRRRGFTLIELIVVITILGILAAFAVPRFATIEIEARSAAASALRGSLQANVALTHALWITQGQPDAVDIGERTIAMSHGYPSSAAIDDTLDSLDGFVYREGAAGGLFSKTDGHSRAIADCSVSYAAAPAPGSAPVILLETDGC